MGEAPSLVAENIVDFVQSLVLLGSLVNSVQPIRVATKAQELSLEKVHLMEGRVVTRSHPHTYSE